MTLREELARRMSHATYANPRYPDTVYDQDWEMFLYAADECIRQMGWARGETLRMTEELSLSAADDAPLTLAPEDYKP